MAPLDVEISESIVGEAPSRVEQLPHTKAASGVSRQKMGSVAFRRRRRTESWHHVIREEWEVLRDEIKQQRLLRTIHGMPPFEHPDNYWKREIYGFICRHLDDQTGSYLDFILNEGDVPHRCPRFSENPFHLALYITREELSDKDRRWKISRFGKQLVYARRHRVPVELLIGFLYQTGTPDQVCSKANHSEAFEPWRATFLARLKEPGGTPG